MGLTLQNPYTGITSGDVWSLRVLMDAATKEEHGEDVTVVVNSPDLRMGVQQVSMSPDEKTGGLRGQVAVKSLRAIFGSDLGRLPRLDVYTVEADLVRRDGTVISETSLDVQILNRG